MVHDSWEPRSLVLLSNQQVHSCVPRPSKLHPFTSLPGWKHTHKLFSSLGVRCLRECVRECPEEAEGQNMEKSQKPEAGH